MLLIWRNGPSLRGLMPAMTEAQAQYPTACQPGRTPSARDAPAIDLSFITEVWHLRGIQNSESQRSGGAAMTFDEILVQVLELLQREQRVSYRALKRRFDLDDDDLEDVKDELIYAKKLAVDEDNRVLVWVGEQASASAHPPVSGTPALTSVPAPDQVREPLSYTPKHLAEKILISRSALEGERKQVTVLFC